MSLAKLGTSKRALSESNPKAKKKGLKGGKAAKGSSEASAWLAEHDVSLSDPDAPPPCVRLADAPFPASLVAKLVAQPGFSAPTAVQGAAWPVAAAGDDLLAISQTGSGKTLSYLLPALTRSLPKLQGAALVAARRQSEGAVSAGPTSLIMVPTRELALQVHSEAVKYGQSLGCRAAVVYGGVPKHTQVAALHAGTELVVATPGRMSDLLDLKANDGRAAAERRPCTSLSRCRLLVLDEADRMLGLGFEAHILAIAAALPRHQTLLLSATWDQSVRAVASRVLSPRHVKLSVGGAAAGSTTLQRVRVVKVKAKWTALKTLLAEAAAEAAGGKGGEGGGSRAVVFANTKRAVGEIGQYCLEAGLPSTTLSGDHTQAEREVAIGRFRSGAASLLIATDVAARGLDIPGVDRIINYDFPQKVKDYIHRIGRTGRAGAAGAADTLFTSQDARHAAELVRVLREAKQHVPAELVQLGQAGRGPKKAAAQEHEPSPWGIPTLG